MDSSDDFQDIGRGFGNGQWPESPESQLCAGMIESATDFETRPRIEIFLGFVGS